MRTLAVVLMLASSPALAQVTAEPAGVLITADTVRANIRVSTAQKIVLTAASLVDK
jgi:hypothetical protein